MIPITNLLYKLLLKPVINLYFLSLLFCSETTYVCCNNEATDWWTYHIPLSIRLIHTCFYRFFFSDCLCMWVDILDAFTTSPFPSLVWMWRFASECESRHTSTRQKQTWAWDLTHNQPFTTQNRNKSFPHCCKGTQTWKWYRNEWNMNIYLYFYPIVTSNTINYSHHDMNNGHQLTCIILELGLIWGSSIIKLISTGS